MTKVVKEYVERKIREGAKPTIDKLEAVKANVIDEEIGYADFEKAIFSSKEYKALDAFIRKLAKEHGAEVRPYYRGGHLLRADLRIQSKRATMAEKDLNDYRIKVDNVVQESLVAMELSKSKEDVDQLIAKAIEGLK